MDGIYGVDQYFYRDINSVTHNFADKYDYYLVVLYKDKQARIIYKKTDGTEQSYETTYALTYTDDAVSSITLKIFKQPNFSLDSDKKAVENPVTGQTSFSFYPMREDITYRDNVLRKNSSNSIVSVTQKLQFHKMYNNTSDSKIERAKTKQTASRTDRSTTEDSD